MLIVYLIITFAGGKVANRKPIVALFYMLIVQAIVLFILTFTAPFKVAGLITFTIMGLFAFMNVPGLQVYVLMLAERFVPSAVDVWLLLSILQPLTPALPLDPAWADCIGLIHTAWIGALMVLVAVILVVGPWNKKIQKRSVGDQLPVKVTNHQWENPH